MRILIAEDDDDVRDALFQLCASEGHVVETVSNGLELAVALNHTAKRGGFDVLVTDYRMPWATGLTVVEQLRSQGAQLPVILVTAFRDEVLQRADALKGVWVVHKPIDVEQLYRTLTEATRAGHSG